MHESNFLTTIKQVQINSKNYVKTTFIVEISWQNYFSAVYLLSYLHLMLILSIFRIMSRITEL